MKYYKTYLIIPTLLVVSVTGKAQLKLKFVSGEIYINDGSLGKQNPKKYLALTDSLDKNLKKNGNDTTSLFLRAMLYLSFNDHVAKPFQGENGALENLTTAKDMANKAIALKMKNFELKVLQAQVYKELAYCFAGDETWKYGKNQIEERRSLFNIDKTLANQYYGELAKVDKMNAYDYEKLKVTTNYPL